MGGAAPGMAASGGNSSGGQAPAPGYGPQHAAGNSGAGQAPAAGYGQSAEFFLSNYRLGKTLGIGSFGKVLCLAEKQNGVHLLSSQSRPGPTQVS